MELPGATWTLKPKGSASIFRPRTIKVSDEKPPDAREFSSPPRAESMFWEGEVA
jgi:hypothetical protein